MKNLDIQKKKFKAIKDILEKPFPELHITEQIRDDVLKNPERYHNCDIRIRMGNFYTDKEYEKKLKKALKMKLPKK